jgi:hypothetical protein
VRLDCWLAESKPAVRDGPMKETGFEKEIGSIPRLVDESVQSIKPSARELDLHPET